MNIFGKILELSKTKRILVVKIEKIYKHIKMLEQLLALGKKDFSFLHNKENFLSRYYKYKIASRLFLPYHLATLKRFAFFDFIW